MMLPYLFLLISFALADVSSDLELASNSEIAEGIREKAFSRLVSSDGNDKAYIVNQAQDPDGSLNKRWVAIRVLGKMRGKVAKKNLPSLVSSPIPGIRTAAVSALGDVGSWDYSSLVAKKLQDETIVVRAASAEALGKIGDPSVIPQLGEAVLSKENYYRGTSLWVRRHFVEALGKIKNKKAFPVLLKTISDEDKDVSRASIKALESIAGFDFQKGRNQPQQKEAWKRWVNQQLGKK